MPNNDRPDAALLARLSPDDRDEASAQARRWEDSCVAAYHAMQRQGFPANVYPRILYVSALRESRIKRGPQAALDFCAPGDPEATEATVRNSAARDYASFLGISMSKRPTEAPEVFPTVRFDPQRMTLVIERQVAERIRPDETPETFSTICFDSEPTATTTGRGRTEG